MDPMLFIPLLLLGAMLIFMWRGNKKRAEQQSTLREQMVVGADVMTQAGIFGTITDIDAENNVTTIETSPGVPLRVHSATILNVITPTVPDDASALSAMDAQPATDDVAEQPAVSETSSEADTLRADEHEAELGEPNADVAAEAETADRIEAQDGDAPRVNLDTDLPGQDPLGDYRGNSKA